MALKFLNKHEANKQLEIKSNIQSSQ